MTTTGGFSFRSGNLAKLRALPKYALGRVLSWGVPRDSEQWVFGSGIGVAEGALSLARELRAQQPDIRIIWTVDGESLDDNADAQLARNEGFVPVLKASGSGFWNTLRASVIVVTHGLGDVNRFGIFGARVIHLGHGAPLKKLHLDSPITTSLGGPAPVRWLLHRMYLTATRSVELYVAGSTVAADRLRSAYRVAPGKVRVLGDPRDDLLAAGAGDPVATDRARAELGEQLGISVDAGESLVLYAPTWRDGAPDPGIPDGQEITAIRELLRATGAHLVIRSHPLGAGAYDAVLGERVHLLGSELVRDITPLLGAFDAVITDYSSLAVDFSLLGRPIVWFAPDLRRYASTRGLYEPLEVTAAGQVQHTWSSALARLAAVLPTDALQRRSAESDARALSARFHAHPEGGAAARVLAEIVRLSRPDQARQLERAVFFESYYGRQVSCNPLAIDREIAERFPEVPRYWSVTSEHTEVPRGAIPVLVGGPDWLRIRRAARLLVVNDWLRFGFRRRRGQTVLQTWHGTMLKRLALERPRVGARTRLAILRESRRWSLMLSQNPHSSEQFRRSYGFRGEILELGYPRDDRLARSLVGRPPERIVFEMETARRALGVRPRARVLAYLPTWREAGGRGHGTSTGPVDLLDVRALAEDLGDEWILVVRGHTRAQGFGGYADVDSRIVDVSRHPDVNDVILAADLLVTDYSSVMFDAAVARVSMAFFVPDLEHYRERERGFTFDFERIAPGPLLTTREQVHAAAEAVALGEKPQGPGGYDAWTERFVPWDDGRAAERVVDALIERGAL